MNYASHHLLIILFFKFSGQVCVREFYACILCKYRSEEDTGTVALCLISLRKSPTEPGVRLMSTKPQRPSYFHSLALPHAEVIGSPQPPMLRP